MRSADCADIRNDAQSRYLGSAHCVGDRGSSTWLARPGALAWGAWFLHGDGSAVGFGARLLVTVAVTFVVVGAVGYALIDRQLNRRQVNEYAAIQRADAQGFEHEAASVSAPAGALSSIDRLLDAIGRRPGTLEALLIDRNHIVRAAGEDRFVGTLRQRSADRRGPRRGQVLCRSRGRYAPGSSKF